jgi:hypothetical protein
VNPAGANLDEVFGRTPVKLPPLNSRREKWLRWIDRIREDTIFAFTSRSMWRGVNQIIADNPDIPDSHFFFYWGESYVSRQASAIRREADTRDDVAALGRLLLELVDTPELITRQWFVSGYDWGMQHMGDEHFDRWTTGRGSLEDVLDPAVPARDLALLRTSAEMIRDDVNARIAHRSKREPPPKSGALTFKDLDDALDVMGELVVKYLAFLTHGGWSLEAIPQYDWVAPFRIPWIKPPADG